MLSLFSFVIPNTEASSFWHFSDFAISHYFLVSFLLLTQFSFFYAAHQNGIVVPISIAIIYEIWGVN